MPKSSSEKTHVSECRITRKSGITYVYERLTQYSKELKRTVTLSTRLLGKILPGATEMVATRPRGAKGYRCQTGGTRRIHVGLTNILEWAGRESGIDADVQSSLRAGEAEKILSVARFWLATDGNALPRLEGWQLTHEPPYTFGISEDVYGELFKSVGINEDAIQRYFRARSSRLSVKPVIAYDSTTISSYSVNQLEARRGFNKDRDGLNTVKLLTLYSVKDEEPVAFAKQPGNVPDVIAMENAIEQLRCFDIDKPLVTTDTGYYSEANVCELCRRNMKFLTLVDTDVTMSRQAVDKLRAELGSMGAVCPFDYGVSGASMSVMHEFSFQRRRTRGGIRAGQEEKFTRRLYLHAFRSSDLRGRHESAFRQKLMELKGQVESGVTEFTEAARKRIDRYLIQSRQGRGGRLRVTFNEEECAKAREYFGYFVLVSNTPLDTFEALENYRLRERIEELFQDEKGCVDGRRTRLWHPDALRGRMFAQFVALGYRCFIMKRIRAVKAVLGKEEPGKTQDRLKLERSLLNWLKQRSLAQILDWYDCVEETTVKTEAGNRRWTTESVARDRLFLELLGVTKIV